MHTGPPEHEGAPGKDTGITKTFLLAVNLDPLLKRPERLLSTPRRPIRQPEHQLGPQAPLDRHVPLGGDTGADAGLVVSEAAAETFCGQRGPDWERRCNRQRLPVDLFETWSKSVTC